MDAGVTVFTIAYVAILIVPGIIFKRFYFNGAFSKQFNLGLFADRLITSFFCGILVQIASLLTFSRIINVSYDDFKKELIKSYSTIHKDSLPDLSYDQVLYTFYYAVYCVALAALLGLLLYKLVRFFKLDLRIPAFRFANQWHYYFRGEILKTNDFKGSSRGKVISTEVDVMLKDNNGKSNLFSGLLTQYTINANHQLETIYLTGATRFSQTSQRVKPIPGDIFIIPYETIQNLNIRYNFLTTQKKEVGKYIVLIFSTLLLIGGFYYPWVTDLVVWKKILGTFLLFLFWLFLTSLIMSFFNPTNGSQALTRGAKVTILFFVLLTLFLCKLLFGWEIPSFLKLFTK